MTGYAQVVRQGVRVVGPRASETCCPARTNMATTDPVIYFVVLVHNLFSRIPMAPSGRRARLPVWVRPRAALRRCRGPGSGSFCRGPDPPCRAALASPTSPWLASARRLRPAGGLGRRALSLSPGGWPRAPSGRRGAPCARALGPRPPGSFPLAPSVPGSAARAAAGPTLRLRVRRLSALRLSPRTLPGGVCRRPRGCAYAARLPRRRPPVGRPRLRCLRLWGCAPPGDVLSGRPYLTRTFRSFLTPSAASPTA